MTHTATGDISVKEITNALAARLQDPDYRPGMRVLWDCRNGNISALSTAEIERLIAFNSQHANARGGGVSAIVVSRDVDYGICRMFLAYADSLPWPSSVFRDFEDAILWLSCPESERASKA